MVQEIFQFTVILLSAVTLGELVRTRTRSLVQLGQKENRRKAKVKCCLMTW